MRRSARLFLVLFPMFAMTPVIASSANSTDPGAAYANFSRIETTGNNLSAAFTNRAKADATEVRAEIDLLSAAGAAIAAVPVSAPGPFAPGSTTRSALKAQLPALHPYWARASARLDGVEYSDGTSWVRPIDDAPATAFVPTATAGSPIEITTIDRKPNVNCCLFTNNRLNVAFVNHADKNATRVGIRYTLFDAQQRPIWTSDRSIAGTFAPASVIRTAPAAVDVPGAADPNGAYWYSFGPTRRAVATVTATVIGVTLADGTTWTGPDSAPAIVFANAGISHFSVAVPSSDASSPPTYNDFRAAGANFTNADKRVATRVEAEFDFVDDAKRSVGVASTATAGTYTPGVAIRGVLAYVFDDGNGCPVPDERTTEACTVTTRLIAVNYADGSRYQRLSYTASQPPTKRRIVTTPDTPVEISAFGAPILNAGPFESAIFNVTFADRSRVTAKTVTIEYRAIAKNGAVLMKHAYTATGKFSPNIAIVKHRGLAGIISGTWDSNGALWHGYLGGRYIAEVTAQIIAVTYADGTSWTLAKTPASTEKS